MVAWMGGWSGPADATEPFFIGLGDLPGGSFSSRALDVSADGTVVVGVSSSAPGAQAFRWTQGGGMIGLGDLPGTDFYSSANSVSDDGSVVVGLSNNYLDCGGVGPCRPRPGAFRWTEAGGMTLLGSYGTIGAATDVSADGSVVVGDTQYYGPFRWTQETGMEFLTSVGTALGVSTDGSVVVVVGGGEVFRWTLDTGMVSLGELGDLPGGAIYSTPHRVSADGSIVVGTSNTAAPGSEAFRWTQSSGIIGLGVRPGFEYSWANDVSNGSIVVGFNGIYNTSASDEAFLWDATHGMRGLRDVLVNDFGLGASLVGWTLRRAEAISADGQFIVGSGTNPSGNNEAWLARLAIEPTLPGDYNQNGIVDTADYTVWRDRLGQSTTLANEHPAAATPGLVDAEDYAFWKANFGQTLGAGAAAHLAPGDSPGANYAVPEPAALALAVGACGWICAARRRDIVRQPQIWPRGIGQKKLLKLGQRLC
jgi:probable HAF family extracellular repeat protein